jgi:hypothetical protein
MARAIRWIRDHRPEDLLLNGLLLVAILGAVAVGYWAWRADSQAARPEVTDRVVTEPPRSTRARATTTTTAVTAPDPTTPPVVAAPPLLLPDTGPAPAPRSRRGVRTRAPAGTVVTAPPQVLTSLPTTPPTTAPAPPSTTRPTPTTTRPTPTTAPPTTTTTDSGQVVG